MTRLWNLSDGKEVCRLISMRSGDWAVVDPAGRFDASNGGDFLGVHWQAGNTAVGLNQLQERFHDPGLLAKHLGSNTERLRSVEPFRP